jgi:hypothetical protein
MKWADRAVLLFGIANAILYSSLLPLWEGFDETFHYAYVQYVSRHWSFPVLGQTPISEEIWEALQLQPVSHYIQASTRAPINFTQYFDFSGEQRAALRQRLESLPAGEKDQPHADLLNYEVNQPPIPYLLMALPDRMMSWLPITQRVLVLRLLLSVASVVLIWTGIRRLSELLLLPTDYATDAAFCVFCSQMLYGTIAHVCNDALAVPVMIWLLWSAVRAVQAPSTKSFAILGLMLSLGLLTKAYFLFMVPLALVIVCRRLRAAGLFAAVMLVVAGPWYWRNFKLYHDLAGTGEKTSGFGPKQLAQALYHLPWRDSIAYMATSSLWTGNNSFTTFSARTLYLVLLLLAAGVALLLYKRSRWQQAEIVVLSAIVLFSAGLVYITAAFFFGTNGATIAAVPWYMQVLLAPVMLLAFVGMARGRTFGSALSIVYPLLWAYLISATYVVKLIPLYGGFTEPRAHLSDLYSWYIHRGVERSAILSSVCLTPAWWIYVMTAVTVVLAVSILAMYLRLQSHSLMRHP